MDSNSPAILVDLPYCYLPYEHPVRVQIRRNAFAAMQRLRALLTRRQAAARGKDGKTKSNDNVDNGG